MPQARKAKRGKPVAASTGTWTLLNDALDLIANAYQMSRPSRPSFWRGGPDRAANMLDTAVRAGDVPIRCARFEGKRWNQDGELELWTDNPPLLADAWEHGRIHTQLSSIYLEVRDKGFGTFFRVEAGSEAVRKLLPKGYEPSAPATALALPEPAKGLKRGPKPADYDLLQLEFYRMLIADGVGPDTGIKLDYYAGQLVARARKNKVRAPATETLRTGKLPEWALIWKRQFLIK